MSARKWYYAVGRDESMSVRLLWSSCYQMYLQQTRDVVYCRRISGPLLERMDLHVEVESVSLKDLMELEINGECSADIRTRVVRARNIQANRFKNDEAIHCNAQMPDTCLEHYCVTEKTARSFLIKCIDQLQLSTRSYTRILKVARTIADLKSSRLIELPHVAEAIHCRGLDRPLGLRKDK